MSELSLDFFNAKFRQVLDDKRQTREDVRSARDGIGRDIQQPNLSLKSFTPADLGHPPTGMAVSFLRHNRRTP